jgi:hypothetical protein
MANFESMLLSAAEGCMEGESREKRELPRNCKGNESLTKVISAGN